MAAFTTQLISDFPVSRNVLGFDVGKRGLWRKGQWRLNGWGWHISVLSLRTLQSIL